MQGITSVTTGDVAVSVYIPTMWPSKSTRNTLLSHLSFWPSPNSSNRAVHGACPGCGTVSRWAACWHSSSSAVQLPFWSSSFCSLEATLAGLGLCPWWKRYPHHPGSLFPRFPWCISSASAALGGSGHGRESALGSPAPDLLYQAGLTWGMAPARPFQGNLNFCWIKAVV